MSKTGGNEVTNNNDKNNENVNENEGMNKNEGISPEKEAEYRKIFERLDFDSDGRIGVEELKKSLKENGIRGGFPGHAEVNFLVFEFFIYLIVYFLLNFFQS